MLLNFLTTNPLHYLVSILSHSLGTVIMYDLLVRKQINYQISDNKGNIDNWRKLVGEIGVSLELSEDIPPLDFVTK